LPAKMRYEPSLWVRLHRTLYPNFGRIAGPAEAAGGDVNRSVCLVDAT
jgi:hypothetical protein